MVKNEIPNYCVNVAYERPQRPISAVSWCPDGGSKIAIAYCNLEFQATHPDTTRESYIFNVDDPTEPDLVLQPPSFLVSLEYNQKDPNIIAGGCYNGQVSFLSCIMFSK